jgi:uncharacterized protein YcbK (DUF882 family)
MRGPRASKHFTWAELGQPPPSLRPAGLELASALENLRSSSGGRPLHLVSGYRSPERNARVGGAVRSQHLLGRAADIPEGYATVEQAVMAGFTGIGSRGPWAVHVDVRVGPAARWTY